MQLEPYRDSGEVDDQEEEAMTYQDQRSVSLSNSKWFGPNAAILWGLGLTVLLIGIGYAFLRVASSRLAEVPEESSATAEVPMSQAEQEAIKAAAELKTLQEYRRVQEALSAERSKVAKASADVTRLLHLADDAREAIGRARRELQAWQQIKSSLPTSEEGKRLAADSSAVTMLTELFNVQRKSESHLDNMLHALDDLVRPAEESQVLGEQQEGFYQVNSTIVADVHRLLEEARQLAASYRKPQATVQGLLRTAPAAASMTLDEAIKAQEAEWASEEKRQTADRIRKVREKTLGERLDERERQEQALADEQLAIIEAARKKKEEEVKLQRLVAKAKRQNVAAGLEPFTSRGYHVYGRRDPNIEQKPYSLTYLRSKGALTPSRKGLETLYQMGHSRKDKSRPRWNWNPPTNILKPEVAARVKEVQDVLNEYGPALVEMGLLDP